MTRKVAHVRELPMLSSNSWQMSYGERAAIEGVLAQLRPRVAIELGSAEGGSLARIAAYSDEVHSFDLVPPAESAAILDNVVFHTGDSHTLLSGVLDDLAATERFVEFVLVDGDHSADGVRRDLEDLLASDAVRRTVILAHDTMNDAVRSGIEAVDFTRHPKVLLVDLDFVPGYLARREPYRLQLWGGVGLMVVDADRARNAEGPMRDDRFHELLALVRPARDLMAELEDSGELLDAKDPREIERLLRTRWQAEGEQSAVLASELAICEQRLHGIERSLSWRITGPLRTLKRALVGYRDG
jgi:Methyltransferase domain